MAFGLDRASSLTFLHLWPRLCEKSKKVKGLTQEIATSRVEMSKSKEGAGVPEVIERLFASREHVTTGEVAKVAGVTRQAARYHLKAMERAGLLVHTGVGRGGKYQRVARRSVTYPLDGLREDSVWAEEYFALKQFDLPVFDNAKVKPILDFAFTEMLNNAIDHSGGTNATVRWFTDPTRIAFEIEDDGVGVFQKVRESRHLTSNFEAIGELSKGKQTTDPARHSGMGIYFSSRLASKFILSSEHLVWTRDNEREDEAIGWLDQERVGTLVRCEVDSTTNVDRLAVFDSLSHPEIAGVSKTTVRVRLFGQGDFVSRSEAKRIGAHLEDFGLVEIDFSGIQEAGQGFTDELFRVWQNAHPTTELVPINANPAILAMINLVGPNRPHQ